MYVEIILKRFVGIVTSLILMIIVVATRYSNTKNGKTYKCSCCNRQFSVRVGTIFEDSKVSLQKWFSAIYLVTSHKKSISSMQLAKDIGVTQKTAWFMLHRIRKALGLHQSDDKLSGVCEADEELI